VWIAGIAQIKNKLILNMKLLEGKVAIIITSRGIKGIAEVLLNRVQMLLLQFISRICGSFRN
jgi:hypothetical protein